MLQTQAGADLCVVTRDQHAFADGQGKAHKAPFAQEVLERIVRQTFLCQLMEQSLLLLRYGCVAVGDQAGAPIARHMLQKAKRLKIGRFDAAVLQGAAARAVAIPQHPQLMMSEPSSGMTALMAVMATSIMSSSGSLVVMRCAHRPGAAMIRVKVLSCLPQSLINS